MECTREVRWATPTPGGVGGGFCDGCGCGPGGGEKDGGAVPVFLREKFSTPRRMPTQTQVRDGIQWLLHDARPGDTLVFHFSGHGTQVPDENGDEVSRTRQRGGGATWHVVV